MAFHLGATSALALATSDWEVSKLQLARQLELSQAVVGRVKVFTGCAAERPVALVETGRLPLMHSRGRSAPGPALKRSPSRTAMRLTAGARYGGGKEVS